MSGWIKMGTGLGSHPKVKTMRRALKADRLKVIGGLWAVWCVFDEHSASGRLDGYTLDDMDEEIGWKGFSQAMADIGWLVADADGIEAPDYEEHNGPNAKRRALDSSRKGKSRAKGAAEDPDDDPPDTRTTVRTESGTVSASDADKTRNREEKRREEENNPQPPEGGKRRRKPNPEGSTCLRTWLESLKTRQEQPVPPDDPVFAYAQRVGIPREFLALGWRQFRHRYTEQHPGKRYSDWRRVFRNAVEGNWLKLWWLDPASGQYALTTVGLQAQRSHDQQQGGKAA